ncbi:hypothetical protein DFJ43DRAFT_1108521 [Lentinula guzmanii]|uniref:Uncharacterized protein n=1 Tax=Lentinula guzmanii TaxID=2804957 RepID=A0AA38MU63_9AGAR|nr:hypothetical protein DFJ43DRAFT_1108521 [Lentinula guzmanii]
MNLQTVLLILVHAMTVLYAAPLDHNVINPRGLDDISIHARADSASRNVHVVEIQFPTASGTQQYTVPRNDLPPHIEAQVESRLRNAFVRGFPLFDASWKFTFRNDYHGTENVLVLEAEFRGIGQCSDRWCRIEVDQQGNVRVDVDVRLSSR